MFGALQMIEKYLNLKKKFKSTSKLNENLVPQPYSRKYYWGCGRPKWPWTMSQQTGGIPPILLYHHLRGIGVSGEKAELQLCGTLKKLKHGICLGYQFENRKWTGPHLTLSLFACPSSDILLSLKVNLSMGANPFFLSLIQNLRPCHFVGPVFNCTYRVLSAVLQMVFLEVPKHENTSYIWQVKEQNATNRKNAT